MKFVFWSSLFCVLLAALAGCGGGDEAKNETSSPAPLKASPAASPGGKGSKAPSPAKSISASARRPPTEEEQAELARTLDVLDESRERAGLDEHDSAFLTSGSVTYAGGGKYVGGFRNGKRHGLGSFVFPNGDRFRGHYTDGRRQGYGTYEFANGERYEGYFHDGKYHHWGLYVFKNGDKYFGQYQRGKRNGKGTLTKKSGERYQGEFADGKRTGHGYCTFADGSRYVGSWKDDKPEGWGTYLYPAKPERFGYPPRLAGPAGTGSATSKPDFASVEPPAPLLAEDLHASPDLKPETPPARASASPESSSAFQGTAVGAAAANATSPEPASTTDGFLDFENGDRYAGQLLSGRPHGQGAYLFADGSRYLGDFRDGDYHGQGLFTYADGSRYLGQWDRGRYHGPGVLYAPSGQVQREGFWNEGEPAK